MATKFLRGLQYVHGNGTLRASYWLKIQYEFWGYCVNGGASLFAPGGFANTGGSPTSDYITFPSNFTGVATTIAIGSNGATLPQGTINVLSTTGFSATGTILVTTSTGVSTVTYTGLSGGTQFTGCTGGTGTMTTGGQVSSTSLLAFGSDGYTAPQVSTMFTGDAIFTTQSSTPFTAAMLGKALVIWKSASGSSEDSIYVITAVLSSSQVRINLNSGGTPDPSTLHPSFTNRSSINYRVIDILQAGLATTDGQYMVMQFDPTGVNTGQANTQLQCFQRSSNNVIQHIISPGGNWNGTTFPVTNNVQIDATAELGSQGSATYQNGVGSNGNFATTMIADKSFFLAHMNDPAMTTATSSYIHAEIPTRLYPQANDTNPFVLMNHGGVFQASVFTATSTTDQYSGGLRVKCFDGTARAHRTLVKATAGDGNPSTPGPSLSDVRVGYNSIKGTVLASDAVLCLLGVLGQYSLARVRVRNVRFTGIHIPSYHRIGINGSFLNIQNGIAIPWDNTILPSNLFPFGI